MGRQKKAPKRPPRPDNWNYWRVVAQDPLKVTAYEKRGTDRQKEILKQAVEYFNWESKQGGTE